MVAHLDIVGRQNELDELNSLAESARTEGAQLAFVSGPTGIGKTALTQTFCDNLAGFVMLAVSGAPADQYLKYSTINNMIQAAHGDQALGLQRMNLISENSTVIAAGGALIDVLDDLRDDTPLAVVIEDAHLVDAYSLKVLGFAFLRMKHDRLIVVVNTERVRQTRKDMGLAGSQSNVSEIDLTGLSVQSVKDFLVLKGVAVPPSETQILEIRKWSNGNPLYVQALLGAIQGGRLFERTTSVGVPPSLAEAVVDWADAFPQASRFALHAMAVLDTPVSTQVLQEITESADILSDIEPLLDEGALRWRNESESPRLELVHPGQRDALYSSIPISERRELHAKAARVKDIPMAWRHRVAAAASFDASLAAELTRMSENALERGDLSTVAQLDLAIAQVSPDADTRESALLRATRLLVLSGQFVPALAQSSRVADCSASPQKNEALAYLEFARGNDASSAEYLRLAVESFESEDDVARVLSELATLQRSLGLGEQSMRSARAALAMTSDANIIGESQANLAYGAALLHGPAEGLRRLSHLRDNPADIAIPDLSGLVCRGICRGLSGQLAEALSDFRVAARRSAPGLIRRSDFAARIHAAFSHFLLGEWEKARRILSLALDEALTTGRDADFALLHSVSASFYACEGKWAKSTSDLDVAANLAQSFDFTGPDFHVLLSRSTIAFAKEDWAEAITLLTRAEDDSANYGRVRLYGAWFLPVLGVCCVRAQHYVLAAQTLSILEEVEPTGAMPVVARNWLKGNLLHARGDTQLAVRAFRDGLAEPPRGGEPVLHRSLLRCDFGRTLIDLGEKDEAQEHLMAAQKAFRSMGAEPFVAQCSALLEKSANAEAISEAERFWSDLTDREKDTAKLIARGWTNKEIAEELYVSAKTVEYHLGNMYAKGAMRNRRDLRNLVQELSK